jgi:hypothetical protein
MRMEATTQESRLRKSLLATIMLTIPMSASGQYSGQKSEGLPPSRKLPRRMMRK